MSWYYTYYLAVRDGNGLLKPAGPFDAEGKWMHVLNMPRSTASDMHERFDVLSEDACSPELAERLRRNWDGDIDWSLVSACPLASLPEGDILKRAYVKIGDIAYMESGADDWFFPDCISPTEYHARREAQLLYGCEPPKDAEGEEMTPIWEYSYYPYIDESSEEYEAHELRSAWSLLRDNGCIPRDAEGYAILEQG